MATSTGTRKRQSRQFRATAVRSGDQALNMDQIARLAKVSSATVSRVINRPEIVAAATVARVRAAIARTGYVPNRIAGGLASNRSGLIAVVVPSIVHSVFNDTIESMTEALARAGYQVMLGLSGYLPADVTTMLDSILSRRPDGVILTGFAGIPAVRKRLRKLAVPVIETWELPTQPLDMVVGFSHQQIGGAIADFVVARGYRRPYVISATGPRSGMRRAAFCAGIQQHGLPAPRCVDVPMPSTVAHGREALAALLPAAADVDVVVCSSDWLALGVMIEAQRHGLRIPVDLGIVGFGNLDFAVNLEPALTTVHVDGAEIGRQSAQLLIARARGQQRGSRRVDVGATIVERGSTRPRKGAT
jgi:LacI family gluconate utilization system Gnt-I transcriptional repressor